MISDDVKRIFADSISEDVITLGSGVKVLISDFLDIAGFSSAPDNPTKQDLSAIDGGVKGYADLIESGNYD